MGSRVVCALAVLTLLSGCVLFERQVSPLPTPGIPSAVYLPAVARGYKAPMSYGVGGGPFTMDVDWWYGWSVMPSVSDERLVRMVWCLSDYHLALYTTSVILAAQRDYAAGITRTWLVLNEPDDTNRNTLVSQCGGYHLTGNPFDAENYAPRVYEAPEAMAIRYSAMYDLIKQHDPRARTLVGGLGWLWKPLTQDWWVRFVGELQRRGELWKVDGVHVHGYPHLGATELQSRFEMWYRDYHAGLGLGDRTIWISETGAGVACTEWTLFDATAWTTVRDTTMLPLRQWYESAANPGYDSAAWFVSWWGGPDGLPWWCGFLADARTLPATLTPLGVEWTR